jgi:peptidoglycan/LPS O-acetylase OafA/YrhL
LINKNAQLKHLHILTCLRFFAAFLVLGFHFFNFSNNYNFLNVIFQRGYLGVDFFFILSGFVLAYSYYDKINTKNHQFIKKDFFINRCSRILPIYYLALLFSIPAFIRNISLLPSSEKAFSWITIPLTLLFLQSFSGLQLTQNSWNIPSWSLSVELFFYAIFPFFSYPIIKSKNTKTLIIFFFLLNIICAEVAYHLPTSISLFGHHFITAWRNLPFFHLPQFLIGNCLAILFINNQNLNSLKTFTGLFFFGAFVFILFNYPLDKTVILSGNPIVVLTFSGFILFSACSNHYFDIYLPKLLILFGEASFSLYIMQAPSKLVLQQIWSKIFKQTESEGFLYAGYLTICMIAISVVIFKFLENPLRCKFRNSLSAKS